MIARTSLLLCVVLTGCVLPAQHVKTAPPLPDGASQHERFVDVDGSWIRLRDLGPRQSALRPVVLVHGYGSRLESWDHVQPELAQDRRVVALDLRGFGMSERARGDYGPAAHASDLRKLVDTLGLDRPVLVGHSYGGGVILRAALDDSKRYSGLVLIDAFAMDRQLPLAFRWAKVPVLGEFLFVTQFKEVVGEKYILAFHDRGRFADADAIREYRGNMSKGGAVYASLAVIRGMDYAPDEVRYRNIKLPTTIVWGEDDQVTPLGAGKDLAALVDAADMVVLERCGHVPPWERPAATILAIRRLLERVDGVR